MRKVISIVFLWVFLAALYFITASCLWKIEQIKHDIKLALATGKIDCDKTVTFRSTQLYHADWTQPHEFRLDGHMYDVYRTDTLTEGEVIYYVICDEEEEIWTSLFLKFSLHAFPENHGKNHSPLRFLLKDMIAGNPTSDILNILNVYVIIQLDEQITTAPNCQSVFTPPETSAINLSFYA